MSGRHPYEERRPERQNEYFINGDGISREVIQADICRYLGNDALVRPGTHNGQTGYFIRAYRNLTSEMIADLKADSARWEAEVSRSRYDRGSYSHKPNVPHAPSIPPASYAVDVRPHPGPSPPAFSVAPSYVDPYASSYGGPPPAVPYTSPPTYSGNHSPYGSGQTPYVPPYTGSTQPAVTVADVSAYTYTTNPPYGYENNERYNAPRYTGSGSAYENDPDYSPVTSAMSYSGTTVPDPRVGIDPRYTPESAYSERSSRTQSARDREPRRPR
ncbi:hypothetical protein MAP00_004795 [Monascus purpureus]|nr:hypothetical protein MAP00_004795 [Monascus purpureus]